MCPHKEHGWEPNLTKLPPVPSLSLRPYETAAERQAGHVEKRENPKGGRF